MAYQSRKRNYKSRRERLERTRRHIRLFSIFFSIGVVIYLFMTRYKWMAWLETYFY